MLNTSEKDSMRKMTLLWNQFFRRRLRNRSIRFPVLGLTVCPHGRWKEDEKIKTENTALSSLPAACVRTFFHIPFGEGHALNGEQVESGTNP